MMRRRWLGIVLLWVAAVIVASVTATTVSAATAAAGPFGQYIVHPGDTLYRIALNHHVTVSQLAAANGIRNVNRIYVGQVLRIPTATPAIILEQPATGARVTSPVTVRGQANVFEGQVNIRILDSRFRKVGEGFGMAAMGEYAPFTAEVAYRVSADQWGYIDAFWISPKDGAELDKVTVKVYLRRGGVAPTPTPAPTPAPGVSIRYHVHPGDTLTRIALGHRVTVSSIVRENHLRNPNLIYVGQALTISSEHPNIILETPQDGATVENPAIVSGYSDTFEANVVVQVLDSGFRRLAWTTTQGGTGGGIWAVHNFLLLPSARRPMGLHRSVLAQPKGWFKIERRHRARAPHAGRKHSGDGHRSRDSGPRRDGRDHNRAHPSRAARRHPVQHRTALWRLRARHRGG